MIALYNAANTPSVDVAAGIGTAMSLNGTVAHAFCHLLYKALLFMSMGAVLYRTGKIKASELGGLYKSMPLTAIFCMVGAASISAFPFFSGFVAKSLISAAAADQHYTWVWILLLVASAGRPVALAPKEEKIRDAVDATAARHFRIRDRRKGKR